MTTAHAKIAPATTRYRIKLTKAQGNRPLPYWDTLLVNRAAGTVTLSATFTASFQPDNVIRGEQAHPDEHFVYRLREGSPLVGKLSWKSHLFQATEDTEAYVEEDGG